MAIFASAKGGGEKTLPPSGTTLARCYAVCDLGTQVGEFQGKPKKAHKCRIFFELPNDKHVFDEARGPEPFTLSKEFTLSLHKKADLRKVLESWRGRAFTEEELEKFDVSKLIGAPAMVTINHETRQDGDGQYAKLVNVSKLMAGMPMPPAIMKPWVFEISAGKNSEGFNALPDWLKEKISKCEEWNSPEPSHDPEPSAPAPSNVDPDIPF